VGGGFDFRAVFVVQFFYCLNKVGFAGAEDFYFVPDGEFVALLYAVQSFMFVVLLYDG
jgi:hypothetical protein